MLLNIDKHNRIIQTDDFTKKIQEKKIRRVNVELLNRESEDQRGFYQGAVVEYYFLQSGIGGFETLADADKNLKREFNPVRSRDETGKLVIEAGSSKMSSLKFDKFLSRIQSYFVENYYQFPDSEDYNEWINSSPLVGEIYPPLIPLYKNYAKQLRENNLEMYENWVAKHQGLIKQIKKQL